MIVASLMGLSLVLSISLDVQTQLPPEPLAQPGIWTQLSVRQKETALLPLVRRATDCIVRKVSADPRFSASTRPAEINDLIIDSFAACALPVRRIPARDGGCSSACGRRISHCIFRRRRRPMAICSKAK